MRTQFVRNSRYIMEPQLKFGYKKTHNIIFVSSMFIK